MGLFFMFRNWMLEQNILALRHTKNFFLQALALNITVLSLIILYNKF